MFFTLIFYEFIANHLPIDPIVHLHNLTESNNLGLGELIKVTPYFLFNAIRREYYLNFN